MITGSIGTISGRLDELGSWGRSVERLARMVSLSPTFQREGGDDTEVGAARRVFLREPPEGTPRPYAVIGPGDQHRFRFGSSGAQNHLLAGGAAELYLSRDVRVIEGEGTQATFEAVRYFGRVADDIASMSAADDPASDLGLLSINSANMLGWRWSPAEYDESLRFYFCVYAFDWGAQ